MKKILTLLLILFTICSVTLSFAQTTYSQRQFKGLFSGDGADYYYIDPDGVVAMFGTAERKLTVRPSLVANNLLRVGASTDIVPTPVNVGVFAGYSMPIWDTGDNIYEEMYWTTRVPYRWDQVTDVNFKMLVCLAGAEDIGDKFQYQLLWNTSSITSCINDTSVNVTSEVTITEGHNSQYCCYSVPFVLDYNNGGKK